MPFASLPLSLYLVLVEQRRREREFANHPPVADGLPPLAQSYLRNGLANSLAPSEGGHRFNSIPLVVGGELLRMRKKKKKKFCRLKRCSHLITIPTEDERISSVASPKPMALCYVAHFACQRERGCSFGFVVARFSIKRCEKLTNSCPH